jgi:hypothetical protein
MTHGTLECILLVAILLELNSILSRLGEILKVLKGEKS